MNLLFIHQNFPGQFLHLVKYLVDAGHKVVTIGQDHSGYIQGARHIKYTAAMPNKQSHNYVRDFDSAVQNGLCVSQICNDLKNEHFKPDLVVGHSGWGETMYIKDVWNTTPLLNYFEFFYRPKNSDVDFDPEFHVDEFAPMRIRTRNAVNLIGLDSADWGVTPTLWQLSHYPKCYHDRISVIHEGIDTDIVCPDTTARIWLKGGVSLGANAPVITYSARNLEPYRGFHIFMRSLPEVFRRNPDVRVLVVGGNEVSYGSPPPDFPTWKQQLTEELGQALDMSRIHFLGKLSYSQYLSVLRVSSVHVYLTYPFVLSWSLLEALSVGCLVIGSKTSPVEEIITDGRNGYLVDFFDTTSLAERLDTLVRTQDQNFMIRAAARNTVLNRYDLRRICLPAQLALINTLAGGRLPL